MFVAALAAAGAVAAAAPANAAVSHPDPVITSARATASAAAVGEAISIGLHTVSAERSLARPDGMAADGPYPPVEDTFTIPLTGSPNPSLPYVCISKTIYLTAGVYDWGMLMLGPGEDESDLTTIPLASSNYEWADCLFPQQGYYVQRSGLCPLNLPPSDPCVFRFTYPRIKSGTYTVGSWLYWLYL